MHLVLLGAAVLFGGPIVWMVLSSLKSGPEITANPTGLLPEAWQWQNYVDAVTVIPFAAYLRNSLIMCIGCVAGTLLSCSMVAYGFARLQWRGRRLMFGILISTMLLPWQATMIPRFLLLKELGLYNSLGALILPTFLGDAFYIFLLRQFFLTVPEELSEAARLDGCGEWGIFWRIMLPLAKPALATVALFQFVTAWNDFQGPLLYLNDPARFPLAYGLERFVSSYSSETHLLLAAASLFTLPIVVLFFLAQRTFMRGISTGGVKG